MTRIADAYNNPFHIDGESAPPMRSALAVLGCERAEIERNGVDAAFDRAATLLAADADLATVYGRPVTRDDLARAAEMLRDPENRAVSEVLDFPYTAHAVADAIELEKIVEDVRGRLGEAPAPALVDVSIVGRLVRTLIAEAAAPARESLCAAAPALPPAKDILVDLA